MCTPARSLHHWSHGVWTYQKQSVSQTVNIHLLIRIHLTGICCLWAEETMVIFKTYLFNGTAISVNLLKIYYSRQMALLFLCLCWSCTFVNSLYFYFVKQLFLITCNFECEFILICYIISFPLCYFVCIKTLCILYVKHFIKFYSILLLSCTATIV